MLMRDYGQVVTALKGTPWLITEGGLEMILQIVEAHIEGKVTLEELQQRAKEGQRDRPAGKRVEGDVGLLALHGPMFPKANMMTMLSGATDLGQWTQDFNSLMQNDRVKSILLDIDSPGGSAFMVTETAKLIREARSIKPIYAVANTLAASAAMNIASQATEFYMSDSAYVGSVGAYLVHEDESGLRAKQGVERTIIKTPRLKAAMDTPLTADTLEYLTEKVKESFVQFVSDVADGRGTTVQDVLENYGEGGLVGAKQALEAGMVDGVMTFENVKNTLLDGGGTLVEPAGSSDGSKGFAFMSLKLNDSLEVQTSLDKEKEHSEPGTGLGGEPVPRPDPEDEHVDDWKAGGARLQRPPNIPELEESEMNREFLVRLADSLGVKYSEATTDEELATLVETQLTSTTELVREIDQGTQEATKQIEFAKQFPEQAEKLRKLEETSQKHDAREFATGLANFQLVEGEGNDERKIDYKLSALAQTTVSESHLKLAQGILVHDDLAQLVKHVALGAVEQGEKGSSRLEDAYDGAPQGATVRETRQLFTDKVIQLMENDSLDRPAAIAEASKRFPKLAEAYARS